MERLILFRHGKAETRSADGADRSRRLTPRGERESAAMAGTLADMGFLPDVALVSGAARTRETWQAAAAAFPNAKVIFEDGLYLAEAAAIRRAAEAAGRTAATVMVVGHNPGLQELTVSLLIEGSSAPALIARAETQFPTAAAAAFLIDARGRPAFDGLFLPPRGEGD